MMTEQMTSHAKNMAAYKTVQTLSVAWRGPKSMELTTLRSDLKLRSCLTEGPIAQPQHPDAGGRSCMYVDELRNRPAGSAWATGMATATGTATAGVAI
jgi:hypothetical protein